MSDFQSSEVRKARKVHRCQECGEPIQIGEKHFRDAGVYAGHFYSHRVCVGCNALWGVCMDADLVCDWHEVGTGGLGTHLLEMDVFTRADDGTLTGVAPEFDCLFEFMPSRPRLPLRLLPSSGRENL